jgi:hypothetical protein
MYYDDTTRRLNLLSGLVFGAALGAGLALLFLPEQRLQSGGRIVVKAARTLGRDIALRHRGRDADDDGDGDGAEPALSPARQRAARLAKRKFKL